MPSVSSDSFGDVNMTDGESCCCIQRFATPWTVACQTPLSMEFSRQERILDWVAISFFRTSSQPRDQTWVS